MGQEKRKGKRKNNLEVEPESQPQGMVESTLHSLGKIIPGFGELVRGLEKSKAFQERLEAADTEIERRMEKARPLRGGGGTRGSIIPPKTTLKARRMRLEEEALERASQKEVTTDTFDEGDYLMVIAELPDIDENNIQVEARDDQLVLFAEGASRQYRKEIGLPCAVECKPSFIYKNGILRITLRKEQR
ncbi:Hsp20/alpha crystallin family protein [Chloroflexota bacterium]